MTSAFIIYIHPQLQTDSGEESAGLLRVLLYKTDSTIFGGNVPGVPEWTGPPGTVVAALVLLYLSLAASVTSVLYAILAKQLLNLYALACAPGTPRDVDKFKWFTVTLHTVVLLLSLLVQLALLFLSCALTVYIWKINLLVASLILVLTVSAVPIYAVFVLLALANIGILDLSPFQKIWDWVILRFTATPESHHEQTP